MAERLGGGMLEMLLLAIALAVDAAGACAALAARGPPRAHLVAAAGVFGVFQAGMSAVGAYGGQWVSRVAASWDHWVAFVVLAAVGGRMLWGTADETVTKAVSPTTVLGLGIATSLDALASGVMLPMLTPSPLTSIVVIGGVTFVLSCVASEAASALTATRGEWLERLGGVVLLAIGLRILVEGLLDHP